MTELAALHVETPVGIIGGLRHVNATPLNTTAPSNKTTPLTVMLHAVGGGARSLRNLANALMVPGDLLIPDLNGYGQTALKPEFERELNAVEQHLLIVRTLIDHYRQADQPLILIGHSMGGFLSLKTAFSNRFPVAALVAIEPVAFNVLDPIEDLDARSEDLEKVLALHDALNTDIVEPALSEFIAYWGQTDWTSLPEGMRAALIGQVVQISAESLAVARDDTSVNHYRTLQTPVLLMYGSSTQRPAAAVVQRMEKLLPVVETSVVDKAGHMGAVHMSRAFALQINEFLKSHSA